MTTYIISKHTAEEYRQMADESRQREQESYERSDTDGYLSQWALSQMANCYHYLARLVESGGDIQEISWLFHEDGTPVKEFSYVQGEYGTSVRIWDGEKTTWFNESHAKKGARREANDRKKGFVWGQVKAPVQVKTTSCGLNVGYILEPTGDPIEVLSIGNYEDWEF